MRRVFSVLTLVALAACGGKAPESSVSQLDKQPLSVRGWIHDVKGAQRAETIEQEIARRSALFQATSLWVEDSQYASGGISGNGAFVILDVPPQGAVIGFNAPGAETAQLALQNVPPGADLIIPDIVLENGGSTVLDPAKIQVRVPASVSAPTPTGQMAIVGGYSVPVMQIPLSQMSDRRDYPDPGGFRPVATFR